jgi:hypothetical protein
MNRTRQFWTRAPVILAQTISKPSAVGYSRRLRPLSSLPRYRLHEIIRKSTAAHYLSPSQPKFLAS